MRPTRSGFVRVPYVQGCTVTMRGAEYAGVICNLSLLGVYVHVEPLPELRDPLTLSFLLPDGEAPIQAAASVSWVHDARDGGAPTLPTGFGARFVELAQREVQRLAALVAAFPRGEGALFGLTQPQSGRLRIPYVTPCVLAAEDRVERGSVCNLSTAGIYFAGERSPATGRAGIVSFRLPGSQELFERAVVVAWRNRAEDRRTRVLPPGCGLHFVNLGDEDVARLAALVEERVGAVMPGAH